METTDDVVKQHISSYLDPLDKATFLAMNRGTRKYAAKIPMRRFIFQILVNDENGENPEALFGEVSIIFIFAETKNKLFKTVFESFVNGLLELTSPLVDYEEDNGFIPVLAIGNDPDNEPTNLFSDRSIHFGYYSEMLERGITTLFIQQQNPHIDQQTEDFQRFFEVDLPTFFEEFRNPEWLDMKLVLSKHK